MRYILDSVEKKDMEKWFPIVQGVTSNPSLLKKANINVFQFFKNVINTKDGINKKVFVQVSSMNEVKEIIDMWKQIMVTPVKGMRMVEVNPIDNIIFKVTMHPSFYNFIKELKMNFNEYHVAATTVYDIVQINQAMEFRCDYTMVYKHKNENQNLFSDSYKLKQISKSKIKLVGASFRGKNEICEAILNGMDYVTANNIALEETFNNVQLNSEYNSLYT